MNYKLDDKEMGMVVSMIDFALNHLTDDLTGDLELYQDEIKLSNKLKKLYYGSN